MTHSVTELEIAGWRSYGKDRLDLSMAEGQQMGQCRDPSSHPPAIE